MRAGPLSHAGVIETLQEEFVNTWVLAVHLPEIAKSAEDPFVREMAARSHENYLYPVDAQVFSPGGELLDHVCANDHPDVERYMDLLLSAL